MEGYQKWCYKSVIDDACWRKQIIYRIQYDYVIRRKTKQWHGHTVWERPKPKQTDNCENNWKVIFLSKLNSHLLKNTIWEYLCICLTAILLLYFCCYNLRLMDRNSDCITSMPIEIPKKNERNGLSRHG